MILSSVFLGLALALGLLTGVVSQDVCGFYEEGKVTSLTCSTTESTFNRYGPRVGINGVFEEKSYCSSNGQCFHTDVTRYRALYSYNSTTGRRNITLVITAVDRTMTLARCYNNGIPLAGIECHLIVYIRPSKPRCSNAEFVDAAQAVEIACTSDRVYPEAICGISIGKFSGDFDENNRLSVDDTYVKSTQYPGDKEITCVFRMFLPGIAEDRYTFTVRFYSPIPDHLPTAIIANSIPTLDLRAPTFEDLSPVIFDPVTQDYKLDVHIILNPPPYVFSLSVRFDETSASSLVSSQYYSAVYTGNRGGDYLKGTIQLTVATSAFRNGKRTGYFTLTASNGIVKTIPFAATFTITRHNISPVQATCESPAFINGGGAVIIRCSSDRLYPRGQCHFNLLTSPSPSEQVTVSTTNSDSTVYPGDQRVTCEVRLPVAGSPSGQYQFQVDITPTINPLNLSTSATTPSVQLASTQRASDEVDGLTFTYPETGDLVLDVHVTGNPAPIWVTLSVLQRGQRVPVSTQDFRWTYSQTPGLKAGIIEISLSRTLKTAAYKSYRLKAVNGVVGDTEFEYRFMVGQTILPTQPVCEEPVFVNGGATAVVTCTSDRVTPPSECTFIPASGSDTLDTTFTYHKAADQDSTTYDGYKKATCALHVPVTGNKDGDYQFQVEFISMDISKSKPALTPTISLKSTVLYNPKDNNHTFENFNRGELTVDVHVTGNPSPTRITLWVREGENSNSVPVSSRDFLWNYERTLGFEAGVVQLSVAGGTSKSGLQMYTLSIENGVVGANALEYRFTVDYGTDDLVPSFPAPPKEEQSSSDNILPVAIGAGAGGLALIIVVIVVVVVVVKKRKGVPSTPPSDYDYAKPDFDPPVSTVYPNFGYSPDAVPPYSAYSSPYLRPISDRPDSTYALPEYSEIEDEPKP